MMRRYSLFILLLMLAAGIAEGAPKPKVRNVIFMIGDGMGLAQVQAAMDSNGNTLHMARAQAVGLSKTSSASDRVTDSAAGGTALSSGYKTTNGMIGMSPDSIAQPTILEMAEAKGMATGLVATYRITHATPASFIAHNIHRDNEQAIALDFLDTEVDVFIGGGRNMFNAREDGRDLLAELQGKGYTVASTLDEVKGFRKGNIAALVAESHLPSMQNGRGDFLPQATAEALRILKTNNPKGFFVMVEGSQIDGGGHANDAVMVVGETLDFDRAVKEAFDFADKNPGTLVVVTADHETGGLTLPSSGTRFSTTGHTSVMVPIYAYGTGAERFSGVMENVEIPKIMMELLGL